MGALASGFHQGREVSEEPEKDPTRPCHLARSPLPCWTNILSAVIWERPRLGLFYSPLFSPPSPSHWIPGVGRGGRGRKGGEGGKGEGKPAAGRKVMACFISTNGVYFNFFSGFFFLYLEGE